jgi:hypothetical protein
MTVTYIMILIPLLLVFFWFYMFWNMTNNDNLPQCYITVTNGTNPKFDWTAAFIILSIVTAGYYYFTEYRNR